MKAQSGGKIAYWDEVAETAEYHAFGDALRQQILDDDLLARTIDEFIIRRVTRFGLGSAPEQERDHEREYLDFLTQLIYEHHHEETRRQIDELFRRVGLQKPQA